MGILDSARRLSASYVDNFLPFLSTRKSLAPEDRPEPLDEADAICGDENFSDHGSPMKGVRPEADENTMPEADENAKPVADNIKPRKPAAAKKPAALKKPAAAAVTKKVVKVKTVTKAKAVAKAPTKAAIAKAATKAVVHAAVKVKSEPMRRSSRSISHKKGFYSERNLENIVWTGTGTAADPVCV